MHTFLIGLSLFGKVDANKMHRGKKQPYKEAFARMKDLKSFLQGKPVLVLIASVIVKDRSLLWKSCGMVNPIIVDVTPNKENVCLEFEMVVVEKVGCQHD